MKIPNLDRHYTKVAALTTKLGGKVGSCSFPFRDVAELADKVVQKLLIDSSPKFSKKTSAGGVFSWSLGGGWNVAHEHCVRYVKYEHSGTERTLIGLGYDLRHWILDGDVDQVPWRVWFDAPNIPKKVETKLLDKHRLDAFAFDGKHPFFVLIPKKYLKGLERLPLGDEGKYITKLAQAIPEFLGELYS